MINKSTRESFPSLHHGVPERADIKGATDDQGNQTELKTLAFCTLRLTTPLVNTSGEGEHQKRFSHFSRGSAFTSGTAEDGIPSFIGSWGFG